MAFREVGMFEVKEVLRLHFGKTPKKAIARTVGVDPKTVRRYVKAAEELGISAPLDDAKLAAVFTALRSDAKREHGDAYLSCRAQGTFIKKLLDEGVRLTKVRKLLKRTKDADVPYSALYRFAVKELSFRVGHAVRVVDPAAGKELQVDTGWVVTLDVDGKAVKKKAFIFTPTVSRYRFVYPIEQETTEAAIEACEAAWAVYGGIFEILLPDNTKAIVDKASPTSPKIIEAFLEYAQARGITVDPARVRKPKDKPRVEKTVAYVRDDCFGGEKLRTLDEARKRALFWSEHEAGLEVHSTTKRRPKEHFLADEQPRLLPMPAEPYDVPVWGELTVDNTQHVAFAGGIYMLPTGLIDHVVKARADSKLVRFYEHNQLVKVLPRAPRGERSFDPDDYPPEKRAYAMRDAAFYVREARKHGEAIGAFASGIFDDKATWVRLRRLAKLVGLVRRFGAERVEAECRRCVDVEMHDVDRLERMLKKPVAVIEEAPKAGGKVIDAKARFLRPKETWAIKRDEETT